MPLGGPGDLGKGIGKFLESCRMCEVLFKKSTTKFWWEELMNSFGFWKSTCESILD